MPTTIRESGMNFFNDKQQECWLPEECNTYSNFDGVKICDFVIKKDKIKLLFVEAKTSNPRNLTDYIKDVSEKLNNSVAFFYSLYTDRMNDSSLPLPSSFQEVETIKNSKHILLLIVKNSRYEWLSRISEALQQENELYRLKQTKRINQIFCINEELARKKGIIK